MSAFILQGLPDHAEWPLQRAVRRLRTAVYGDGLVRVHHPPATFGPYSGSQQEQEAHVFADLVREELLRDARGERNPFFEPPPEPR